ncbi:uncharacterized protein LOC121902129 isoform X2 [Xyrichtys novacula]|uniref:Uncharacterized protein LOC121902129 isoform X2 n=1 Tax=Xyrichtys novacula TaxID=13765 RepID=A0AAV1F3K2_XYRNO|nr:uncharacterized protein LOC121902129 isoform X2 [Xyrichtys novacula]
MPKLKGWRQSQAATRRHAQREFLIVGPQGHSDDMPPGIAGTGYRHCVNQWPISVLTGHQHKLVIPPEDPDKKFVLIVGDSHLRPFVDGVVPLPEGRMSFGFMSTPGVCADELRIEMLHAAVPRSPDLVIVMAPSNNLTAHGPLEKSSTDFAKLLSTAVGRWFKVIVYDFPPRLNHPLDHQELLRQEFRRVAARMGIRYVCPAADDFPLRRCKLWCRDSVHLSDDGGSPILGQRLWQAAYTELETVVPASVLLVPHRRFPPPSTVTPKVVVRGEVPASQPSNPFEWTVCGKERKQKLSGNGVEDSAPCTQQLSAVGLRECFVRLNPLHFSAHLLDAMEKISPSQLPNPVPHDDEMPPVEPRRTVVASQRIPARKKGRALRVQSPAEPKTTEVPPATEVTSPEVDLDKAAELQTSPGVVTVNTATLSAPQPDGGTQVEQVSSVKKEAVQFLCTQIEGEMSDPGRVSKAVPYNLRTGCQDFKQQTQKILSPSDNEKGLSKYLKKKFLQMKINYHKDFLVYNRRNQNVRNSYKHNLLYQQKLKDLSNGKYLEDEVHKQNVKDRSKIKYRTNEMHKQNVKDRSKIKYDNVEKQRQNDKDQSKKNIWKMTYINKK